MIQIIPIKIQRNIEHDDKLDRIILEAIRQEKRELFDSDIIVVAQKIVSKAEGRLVDLCNVTASRNAMRIAKKNGKDPRLVELIIQESTQIVRAKNGIIISETRHGFICANAGIDQSNVQNNSIVLLPLDPDESAKRLRYSIKKKTGKNIAVIITDTFGRPFRKGQTNLAIGVAGIEPIKSYIGSNDMYGRKLKVTEIAIVDEIASAAELVMGKAEHTPVVLIRGYKFKNRTKASARDLIRPKKEDLFR